MKQELRIFFTALLFYTRIPCPPSIDHDPEYVNKATRYFPLIGWIVGGISFLVYCLSETLFETNTAVLLSMTAGILATGAFHEDGLADTADGFGGGWTKNQILEIMKDSRIGTYGTTALLLALLIKWNTLDNILNNEKNWLVTLLLFVSCHAIARLTAILLVFTSTYAREDSGSKAKPLATSYSLKEVIGASIFGLLPLMALSLLKPQAAITILPLTLLFAYAKRYYEKWLGGYTGDCLGAVEQIAECFFLITLSALWKFM
jgi:adenosylcobinamide-GDP ribazoletransferase